MAQAQSDGLSAGVLAGEVEDEAVSIATSSGSGTQPAKFKLASFGAPADYVPREASPRTKMPMVGALDDVSLTDPNTQASAVDAQREKREEPAVTGDSNIDTETTPTWTTRASAASVNMTVASLEAQQDNTTLPVSRPPPEIYTQILTILATIDPPVPCTSTELPAKIGWIAITHVCQRWRHVALHNPILWASNISVPFALGPDWAHIFLSRAQSYPLTIQTLRPHEGMSPNHSEHEFILANLERTAVLRLHTLKYAMPTSLRARAPILHTLDLTFSNEDLPIHWRLSPVLLLDGITAAHAPALRHLRVHTYLRLLRTSPLLVCLVSLDVAQPARFVDTQELTKCSTRWSACPGWNGLPWASPPTTRSGLLQTCRHSAVPWPWRKCATSICTQTTSVCTTSSSTLPSLRTSACATHCIPAMLRSEIPPHSSIPSPHVFMRLPLPSRILKSQEMMRQTMCK
ncbi:hypothetical protein FA95DRAFT_227300 [Auriscalpium vulgare]|uniref:Uncharacterized protein n=1 Tax=Auriscalpium vulgare TaxID=40419 RepID=A0ACB8RKG4_9AGAM|nr:hypothetical protein FA95DRAFT_227300 [Auriscalpium vulgare]